VRAIVRAIPWPVRASRLSCCDVQCVRAAACCVCDAARVLRPLSPLWPPAPLFCLAWFQCVSLLPGLPAAVPGKKLTVRSPLPSLCVSVFLAPLLSLFSAWQENVRPSRALPGMQCISTVAEVFSATFRARHLRRWMGESGRRHMFTTVVHIQCLSVLWLGASEHFCSRVISAKSCSQKTEIESRGAEFNMWWSPI
jgi:hypothetical protein